MEELSISAVSQAETQTDYANLNLPSWAPPSSVFWPIWWALYILIIISYGYFIKEYISNKLISRKVILPFLINIILNLSFTYVQFWLDNHFAAFIIIVIIWLSIIWTIYVTYKDYKYIAFLQIPYLIRVSIATVLQYNVRILN